MLTWLHWINNYWTVLVWAVPIVIVWGLARYFLGLKLSLPIAFLGTMIMVFLAGKKMERDNYQKRMQDIKENREKAYEKIDSRHTDDSDVLDRLHDGDF